MTVKLARLDVVYVGAAHGGHVRTVGGRLTCRGCSNLLGAACVVRVNSVRNSSAKINIEDVYD